MKELLLIIIVQDLYTEMCTFLIRHTNIDIGRSNVLIFKYVVELLTRITGFHSALGYECSQIF